MIADTKMRLEEGIKTIQDWCTTNKMQMNKKKSMIIFVPKSKFSGKKGYMKGSILDIKLVKSAKYLGIVLERNLMFNEQIARWKDRAKKTR